MNTNQYPPILIIHNEDMVRKERIDKIFKKSKINMDFIS